MTLKKTIATAALAFSLAGGTAANAQAPVHVIGTEDPADGFVGSLFPAGSPYLVASDGELPFRPFGVPDPVSDALDFNQVNDLWVQAPDSHWLEVSHQTWVIPEDPACEGKPGCEPVGHFTSKVLWPANWIGTWIILDPDGSIGDKIVTFNRGNLAHVRFTSDPVPEVSTWALMLLGFGGVGATLRSRKIKVTLAA
jgi:hypothetical protein